MNINISKIEFIILFSLSIILPWSIIFATPQLHIGYWGQIEGMIAFSHFIAAITSFFLIIIGLKNKNFRILFANPIVLIPSLIGIFSIISALFQRLPILSLYGSPQIGQGAFWYFTLSILTMLYLIIMNNKICKLVLFFNFLLITLTVSIGSFYPTITGIVISFFGFNDWLAFYFTVFFLSLIYVTDAIKLKIKKEILGFLIFLLLGFLFWKIDNNSALAIWLILTFGWFLWILLDSLNFRLKTFVKYIYNPLIFTCIPIFFSLIIIFVSFMFWDGTTNQTEKITDSSSWTGHLGTLVARGSIVRVLFDDLNSIKSILFGYGWGSISELLLVNFTPEVFFQINTGNRVHFHTHNELFEHIFSVGIIGAFLYILYMYHVFRHAFAHSISVSFIWLLYFCISAFWFQWISTLALLGMFSALLILNVSSNFNSTKLRNVFKSNLFYAFYIGFISIFLFYGAYIGYFTASKHTDSFRSAELIKIAEESKIKGNCSSKVYDYGKGGMQFSQKFNGFSNYYKDQVMLYGKLNDSDYNVLEWNLCASNEIITKKQASLELINVHINTLSMLSILPGKHGIESRKKMQPYIDLWEEKVRLLLLFAPKRVDQSTTLISYYLQNENDLGVKSICLYIEQTSAYQGFCDLAMGSIYLKEGKFEKGMTLIRRANKMGVLDSDTIDEKTSRDLKKLLNDYKKNNTPLN